MTPFGAALVRAIFSGAGAAVAVATAYIIANIGVDINELEPGTQADPYFTIKVVCMGLAAFFGASAVRGLGEGTYDQNRANTGDMKSSDVGMSSPKVQVVKSGTGGTPVAGQTPP